MRNGVGLLVLVLGLGLAAPAQAQKSLSTYQTPVQTINVPIDMSRAISPPLPPATRQPFSLTNFLARTFLPGTRPARIGISPLPAPASFPSTRYPNAMLPSSFQSR